ncbi:hypothetical protein ACGGZK_01585 [Agromyces sp. MMS24-K17]|uniref:hypothetical protein n=1 Tax=Agromyces sp. MMS24-K17 TaxID=3372850 RepID=UPI00375448E4
MDTALPVITGPEHTHPAPTFERLFRRTAETLTARRGRAARQPLTHEELAERWERRVEAERLREQHRLAAMVRQF